MSFYTKEFKEAINHLPPKEKDKLILRLLKRDIPLLNRLYFELIDDKTVEERREFIEELVVSKVERMTTNFYSVSYLKRDISYVSGDITEHVGITKDKYGEVSLNLLLLNEVLEKNKENILNTISNEKLRKFCVAIIARIFKVLLLINKMDTDLVLDFKDDLTKLGNHILDNRYLMKTAMNNGLDINWLLNAAIPTNLANTYKEIKKAGFLR